MLVASLSEGDWSSDETEGLLRGIGSLVVSFFSLYVTRQRKMNKYNFPKNMHSDFDTKQLF